MGWPAPQSLKKMVTLSPVVTVGMMHSYLELGWEPNTKIGRM
jgi:hypothetical protein